MNTIVKVKKEKMLFQEEKYIEVEGNITITRNINKVREEYELDNGEKILITNKRACTDNAGFLKIVISNNKNQVEFMFRKFVPTANFLAENPIIEKGNPKVVSSNIGDRIYITSFEGFDTNIDIYDLLGHRIRFITGDNDD